MNKPIVFMFSGQGSQYYHMGKELYERHPKFKLWMDHCDEIVHPIIGTSLVRVLYQHGNKSDTFDKILYTNPALLCIEYSLARVLMDMGVKPDYVLGYSLGEISASLISEAISLEEGIVFVTEWARVLEKNTRPAAMLAVLKNVEIVSSLPELFSQCWITGKNFQSNFVVSGLQEHIETLQKSLKTKNIISIKLPVNYGFHTELMDTVEAKFKYLTSKIKFHSCRVPIISACTGGKIQDISEDHLWSVTRKPVDFEQTIRSLLMSGNYCFIDVGPSGSLAVFVKYLMPEDSNSVYFEIMNQFGQDVRLMERLISSFRLAPVDFAEA